MKVSEHIAEIRKQIKAMRDDGHDDIPLISIHLNAIEYATGAVIEAEYKAKQEKT